MFSQSAMKNASYLYCYALLALCGLTFVSVVIASPPIIYTYHAALTVLMLSVVLVGLTVVEVRLRGITPFHWKQAGIALPPCALLMAFSTPSLVWLEYHLSDFEQQTTVIVENKHTQYYRNNVNCYQLSLKNSFIDGDLCASYRLFADSPLYHPMKITYKKSWFGYLVQ